VDYDGTSSRNDSIAQSLWPKAQVFVSDPSNGSVLFQCVNVTPFFSFEEAYCYFCWDTVDRVTDGKLYNTDNPGDICIGNPDLCGMAGNGTTRWYMTIKFNNRNELNLWLNKYGPDMVVSADNIIAPWLPFDALVTYTFPVNVLQGDTTIKLKTMEVTSWLQFSVGGVVVYPWTIKTVQGVRGAYGTMTIGKANGFASNPWCGVLDGSVKIVERTDVGNPICVDSTLWPAP
jgi:hypothetical protein